MLSTLLLASILITQAQQMSAIRVNEFGGPEVLKIETVDRPVPGDGELLVKVHAAAVNPIDWKIRAGGRGTVPYTPGFDLSGVVEQVGGGAGKFKAGDAVYAMLDLRRGGAYAEYAIVKESEAAAKPAKATHVEAAAIPLVTLTAWQALFDTADLQANQTVLIHGGAGGVGSVAVQLAKWKGAKVIATASKENHEFLKEIGADVTIDYRSEKFEEIAKEVDVVLDTIGGETRERSWQTLKPGGMLVSIVGGPSQERAAAAKVRAAGILVKPNSAQLTQIAELIDSGKLKPIVTHRMPLADAAKAHQQSETKHTRGKIVLEVVTQ